MELANRLSIEDFFENEYTRTGFPFWNHMCWAVMGFRQWQKWRMSLSAMSAGEYAEMIEKTIRPAIVKRLNEFVFIGLQEDFARSVEFLFPSILGKQPPRSIRADHSLRLLMSTQPDFKRSMERQPVTPRLESALESITQLDRIVYEEGRKLYMKRMEAPTLQV
jgi:hypothetical protein